MASSSRSRSLEIHKFGGASLANAPAIKHAVSIIGAQQEKTRLVVVVSAMAGVTNALLDIATRAVRGDVAQTRAAARALRAKHVDAARALLPKGGGPARDGILDVIGHPLDELEQLAAGLATLRELTPRTSDYLIARGERLSAQLVTAALAAEGIECTYVDALEVVKTDDTFGNASPDLAQTERSARRVLRPLLARGRVVIVPGFLGAAPDGQVATLGRGGSDLSATLLARVLGAREVSLWKDVPGLLTADPRIVPDARVVPQVHV